MSDIMESVKSMKENSANKYVIFQDLHNLLMDGLI